MKSPNSWWPVARALSALLFVALTLLPLAASGAPLHAQGRTNFVLAFYYAWYRPESFGPGKTAYQPAAPYQSSDAATIQRHVSEARSAGLDGFVQSWYGPAEPVTNGNFQTLLDVAAASGFKAAIDFEPGVTFSNNDQRAAALQSLLATHANHPAYLRLDGKPVIFFWANWAYSVDDWAYIRNIADPGRTSIWIAEGARTEYLQVFDGLHLYNIAWSANPHGIATSWGANTRAAAETYGAYKYWVATAMPGFDDRHLGRGAAAVYRDRADGAYYQNSFAAAAASSPDLLIITSFNEWAEGSNIEPSTAFGDSYLQLTSQLVADYKAGGVPPPPPLPQPSAEATPAATAAATQENHNQAIAQAPTAATAAGQPVLPPPQSDGLIIYEVQAGDTLSAIAFRFGLSLDDLYRLNDLDENSLLALNQPILLGYSDGATAPAATAAAASSAAVYQVALGDTLLAIAFQHNLTIEELLRLNPTLTEDSLLQLGQEIVVAARQEPVSVGGSTDFPEGTATVAGPAIAPATQAPATPQRPTHTPQATAAIVEGDQMVEEMRDDQEASNQADGASPAQETLAPRVASQTPSWLAPVLLFILFAGGGGALLVYLGQRRTTRGGP